MAGHHHLADATSTSNITVALIGALALLGAAGLSLLGDRNSKKRAPRKRADPVQTELDALRVKYDQLDFATDFEIDRLSRIIYRLGRDPRTGEHLEPL